MTSTKLFFGLALLGTTLASAPARATWSIVAVNAETGEVGAAGASCIGNNSVLVIYGAVRGRGAIVAQAYYNQDGRDRGVEELALGTPPEDIIATITSFAFDPQSSIRQYGVVDLEGRSAGFTGIQTTPYAEDRQSTFPPFTVSVQGNILTGIEVIDGATSAFAEPACDLADHLMNALEAGALGGIGDGRCTPAGRSADSAFIAVEEVGGPGGESLRLEVIGTAPVDPTIALRERFSSWRAQHPCGPSTGSDAGSPDADGGVQDVGVVDPDAGVIAPDAGESVPSQDEGCSCRSASPGRRASSLQATFLVGAFFAFFFAAGFLLRRPGSIFGERRTKASRL